GFGDKKPTDTRHGLSKRKLSETSGRLSLPRSRETGARILRSESGSRQAVNSLRNRRRHRTAATCSNWCDEAGYRRAWPPRNVSRLWSRTRLRIFEVGNRSARLSRPQHRHL